MNEPNPENCSPVAVASHERTKTRIPNESQCSFSWVRLTEWPDRPVPGNRKRRGLLYSPIYRRSLLIPSRIRRVVERDARGTRGSGNTGSIQRSNRIVGRPLWNCLSCGSFAHTERGTANESVSQSEEERKEETERERERERERLRRKESTADVDELETSTGDCCDF